MSWFQAMAPALGAAFGSASGGSMQGGVLSGIAGALPLGTMGQTPQYPPANAIGLGTQYAPQAQSAPNAGMVTTGGNPMAPQPYGASAGGQSFTTAPQYGSSAGYGNLAGLMGYGNGSAVGYQNTSTQSAPNSMGGGSGFTQMRAPTGETDWIHPDDVSHYTSRGAVPV